jgi:hypothetical protein
MASIGQRIEKFLRSPRGQQLIVKAREYASRPENQRRLGQLRERLATRAATRRR